MQKVSKSAPVEPALLVTADDRTGVLETGGACADAGFRVRFVEPAHGQWPAPASVDDDCLLIDIDSRHRHPRDAARRAVRAHGHGARFRCHKMDSGLRGNWAHEVAALLAAGRRIGVLASFPDAGRRCVDGTVFVHDVPVADSPLGRDPRNRLTSSRPLDYLLAAGCGAALANGDLRVFDARDNAALHAAAALCRNDERMLVGTTGAIGAYVSTLRAPATETLPALPRPALILCGSLHPTSRAQIAALRGPVLAPDDGSAVTSALRRGADAVVATPAVAGGIDDAAAEAMAARLAAASWAWLAETRAPSLIVLGGDTAAAVLGDQPLRVLGSIDTGLPLCTTEDGGLTVVTKGGSIGAPDTLAKLLGLSARG